MHAVSYRHPPNIINDYLLPILSAKFPIGTIIIAHTKYGSIIYIPVSSSEYPNLSFIKLVPRAIVV